VACMKVKLWCPIATAGRDRGVWIGAVFLSAVADYRLDIGRGPEFAERVWPTPIDNAFSGGRAHTFSQRSIHSQRTDSSREIIHIAGSSDETVRSVFYQLLGAARIGNNYRHAASLRFQNDVAECVGGAGEHKNIRRSVGG